MEQKQLPIIPEEIHLQAIDVVQQKIDVKAFKSKKQHELNVGHKMMHSLDDERIKMELVFAFNAAGIEEPLLFFQIDFHFHVEHLSNFYQLNDEKLPVFWVQLVATLLGISLSTGRGIIFEKLQNAGLANVIIPVVSPHKMLNSKA